MSWNTKIPARLIDFENKVHPSNNYCIGVKMISSGGGCGTWLRIDENDNVVDVSDSYFINHPVYSNIKEVLFENSQVMIKIPKFYIKTDNWNRLWISDTKKDGFRVHPAFMKNDEEIDAFYVGKYQSHVYNDLCGSEPTVIPTVYTSYNDFKTYCTNRNVDGVSGYHMWNIYELSAITMLMLVEYLTTDVQSYIWRGKVDAELTGAGVGYTDDEIVSKAEYRGITGLWGNAWQFIDGVYTSPVKDSSNKEESKLYIWDYNGNQEFMNTGVNIPTRKASESFTTGVNCGYYSSLETATGFNFNLSDVCIPNMSTLVGRYTDGTFSDYTFGRTYDALMRVCCVGGSFDSGDMAGIFAYNFDVSTDESYYNVTTRLAKY